MMDSKDEEKIEEISELIESIKTDSESINTADVDEIADKISSIVQDAVVIPAWTSEVLLGAVGQVMDVPGGKVTAAAGSEITAAIDQIGTKVILDENGTFTYSTDSLKMEVEKIERPTGLTDSQSRSIPRDHGGAHDWIGQCASLNGKSKIDANYAQLANEVDMEKVNRLVILDK